MSFRASGKARRRGSHLRADRLVVVDPLDGLGEQRSYRKNHNVVGKVILFEGYAVGHDEACDGCTAEVVHGRAAKDGMGGGDVDFASSHALNQFGGAGDRAGRADHVVEHEGHFSFDGTAD